MTKEKCCKCGGDFDKHYTYSGYSRFMYEYGKDVCLPCAEAMTDGKTIRESHCRDCGTKLPIMHDKWFLCDKCKTARWEK